MDKPREMAGPDDALCKTGGGWGGGEQLCSYAAPFHPSCPPCTAPNAGAQLLAPSNRFLLPCYGFSSPSESKQTCSCSNSTPPCHACRGDFISALSLPHLMGLIYQPHTDTSNFLPQVAWSSVRSLPPPAHQDQPWMLSALHARRKATVLGNGAGLRTRCHSECVQTHRPALLNTRVKLWGGVSELPALGWHIGEEPGWRGQGAAAAAGC